MSKLDDILKGAQSARLIPVVADSRREERIVSILLATLPAVPSFAERVLGRCGVRIGKTSVLHGYTEVEFPALEGNRKDRPDGVLTIQTRRNHWRALFEAKIDKSDIAEEQIQKYGEIAREHGVDAMITLSNQLVALPTHIPYTVPKKLTNKVQFFHISWISVLTDALLLLDDNDSLGGEQRFILEEMTRYLEHDSSGVSRFKQMNGEWQTLIRGVRNGQKYGRNASEIGATIASWHQEERDLCLMLSRQIGERVVGRLTRKHRDDPTARFKEACGALVDEGELRSILIVPNAAGDIELAVKLESRTISCSMRIDAPRDRKSTRARVNWLVRQLRDVESDEVFIRAFAPGRGQPMQAALAKIKAGEETLESGGTSAPTSFEVAMIKDLGNRFSGRRTFIEDLEKIVPEFYEKVGQHIRAWVPPPPPINTRDRTEDGDRVEEGGEGAGPSSDPDWPAEGGGPIGAGLPES